MRVFVLLAVVLLLAGAAAYLALSEPVEFAASAPRVANAVAVDPAEIEEVDAGTGGPSRHRLDPAAESTGSGDPQDPAQRAKWMSEWYAIIVNPEAHWRDRQDAVSGLARFRAESLPWFVKALEHEHARGLTLMALAELGEDAAIVAPKLISWLRDEDWGDTAAHALSKLGPAGEAVLIEGLDDPNDDIRESIVYALRVLEEPSRDAVNAVLGAFGDASKDVRLAALRTVGTWGVEAEVVVPALIAALTDPDDEIVWRAVTSIGEFGSDGVVAVESLTALLRSLDDDVRDAVVSTLGQIGPPAASAAPSLVTLVDQDNKRWSKRVAPALHGISPAAFVATLDHESSRVRLGLINWLSQDAPVDVVRTGAVIDGVVGRLGDEDDMMRARAVRALGRGGELATPHVPKLIDALEDTGTTVRWQAIYALGRVGLGREDVVVALIAVMDEARGSDLMTAIQSLRRHGDAAAPAVPRLTREIDAATPHTADALRTLGRMGPAARDALPSIRSMLLSDDDGRRLEAAIALAHVSPPAQEAAEVLESFRVHDDAALRLRLVIGLAGAPAQRSILVNRLNDRNTDVRLAAIASLISIRAPEKLVGELIPLLKDPQESVRAAAARGLGLQGEAAKAALPALEAAQEDRVKLVRVAVGKALARIAGK